MSDDKKFKDFRASMPDLISARAYYLFAIAMDEESELEFELDKALVERARQKFMRNPDLGKEAWEHHLKEAEYYAQRSKRELKPLEDLFDEDRDTNKSNDCLKKVWAGAIKERRPEWIEKEKLAGRYFETDYQPYFFEHYEDIPAPSVEPSDERKHKPTPPDSELVL